MKISSRSPQQISEFVDAHVLYIQLREKWRQPQNLEVSGETEELLESIENVISEWKAANV